MTDHTCKICQKDRDENYGKWDKNDEFHCNDCLRECGNCDEIIIDHDDATDCIHCTSDLHKKCAIKSTKPGDDYDYCKKHISWAYDND